MIATHTIIWKLALRFAENVFASLYKRYAAFKNSYYETDEQPLLNVQDYLNKAPLIVIDAFKQREHLQPRSLTLRIEFETGEKCLRTQTHSLHALWCTIK